MTTPSHQSRLADVAAEFYECDRIVIVGVKERFLSKPLSSGWRDLIILFYIKDDPNRHVCEAQVCHTRMAACNLGQLSTDEDELEGLQSVSYT